MSINRHDTRKLAFQALFALSSNPDALPEDVYEALLEDEEVTEVPAYLKELVNGVLKEQSVLDEKIKERLSSNWTISRLSKTDLLILRLAVYEMLYVEDVPAKVALDEALELTKEFSDDSSRRFVNGVLSNLL